LDVVIVYDDARGMLPNFWTQPFLITEKFHDNTVKNLPLTIWTIALNKKARKSLLGRVGKGSIAS
jgi:hypothetical protein